MPIKSIGVRRLLDRSAIYTYMMNKLSTKAGKEFGLLVNQELALLLSLECRPTHPF
jgi:hypothetical protein